MKTRNFLEKAALFSSCVALAFFASCAKDNEGFTSGDTTDVISESITESYFQDMDDMSVVVASDAGSPSSGGRIASLDHRFTCAEVTWTEGSTSTSGVITVDFGTGCTDSKTNVRIGKLILTYSGGPVGTTGFTVVVTTDGYSINGVVLEGTRTIERLESSNSVKHQITLANGKATWPDQSFATRSSSFTREVTSTEVKLDGSATGANRRGRAYTMNIDETLIYNIECATTEGIYMAVKGVKTFISGGRKLTIDYGDGTCDRTVTVQLGDNTRSVNI